MNGAAIEHLAKMHLKKDALTIFRKNKAKKLFVFSVRSLLGLAENLRQGSHATM